MTETRRILIVDDCAEDRATYRRFLGQDSGSSYEIAESESGEDGLQRSFAEDIDCVLLDYNLPDLDGIEFLTELAKSETDQLPAVVMLTGVGNETLAVEAMKNGAQDYLIKGKFSRAEFQRAVDNAIEKMRLVRAVDQHRAELARSNEELSQFAYSAAHDLQAPLRRTNAFCELLQKKYCGQFDEEGSEYLDFIVKCTGQMQDLVSGLLEYGRVGTSPRSFQHVNCSEAVEAAIANLELQLQENEAKVTCDGLPSVYGDRIQLIQLFQNLIGNAVKYCGQRTPVVHVSASVSDEVTQFSVKDNGIGIDPKYTEQVFAVFRRLHSDEEYSGSGIGLATCRKIVERHGGTIWFDSQLGEGSVFHFTIARES